jgi:chromosome segregation ATPase
LEEKIDVYCKAKSNGYTDGVNQMNEKLGDISHQLVHLRMDISTIKGKMNQKKERLHDINQDGDTDVGAATAQKLWSFFNPNLSETLVIESEFPICRVKKESFNNNSFEPEVYSLNHRQVNCVMKAQFWRSLQGTMIAYSKLKIYHAEEIHRLEKELISLEIDLTKRIDELEVLERKHTDISVVIGQLNGYIKAIAYLLVILQEDYYKLEHYIELRPVLEKFKLTQSDYDFKSTIHEFTMITTRKPIEKV